MPETRDWTVTVTHSPDAPEGVLESVVATAVPARDPAEAVKRAVDMVDELGDRVGGSWAVRSGLANEALDPDADNAEQRKFFVYPLDSRETIRRDDVNNDHD